MTTADTIFARGPVGNPVDLAHAADTPGESSGIYRKLVEHSLVGTFVVESGRLLYANQRAAQVFGRSQADLAGLPISKLVIARDRPLLEAELPELVSGRLAIGSAEFRIHHPDARQALIGAQLSRIVYAGRPAVMGVMTDITERRFAEDQAREHLASMDDVAEAMTSHRPYRPAVGPDGTLAELARGRATPYDPQVVDACVHLFRNQGVARPS